MTTRLSTTIAQAILDGFERHFSIFQEITAKTKTYFEQADWQAIQESNKARIYFYDQRVKESADFIGSHYDLSVFDEALWRQTKREYIQLIVDHQQPELAETFFNSIFCRSFDKRFYQNTFIFVRPSISTDYIDMHSPEIKSFCVEANHPGKHLAHVLQTIGFDCPYQDFDRDITRLTEQFHQHFCFDTKRPFEIQIIQQPFFRNKAAYVIGKVVTPEGFQPLCIALLNDPENGGLYVDALLMEQRALSSVFSFTRAYFLVETQVPAAVIAFLKEMLPNKTKADLYSAIGFHKQGKTLLYRMFLRHMRTTTETLKAAPGIAGMVMLVFTFPVYPYVFKLIRDAFRPPKEISHKQVKEKYRIVKNHDRVGRLADTWEFSNVAFPLDRIEPEFLAELKAEAASSVSIEGDLLIIKHLYIEQKMQPLNIYLHTAGAEEMDQIVNSYGMAIKELIHANIFPGDMLLKNFGVTRQNRVVFYDYDEIVNMDEVNFRKIPEPQTPEQEMASEPWYHVAPNDVFPEEFCQFLFSEPKAKEIFLHYHADLLEPDYWQAVQEKVASGVLGDVFPYDTALRFSEIYKEQP